MSDTTTTPLALKFPEIPRGSSPELYKYFIELELNLKKLAKEASELRIQLDVLLASNVGTSTNT
jgi:hypothetical protein